MSARRIEAVLAQLYVDDAARARFVADPLRYATKAGLDPRDALRLASIDRVGLVMAASSFAAKRRRKPRAWWLTRWLRASRSDSTATGA
jgi:hypothetical protein